MEGTNQRYPDAATIASNYSAWPPNMPGCLYNAMIAPAVPLAISGSDLVSRRPTPVALCNIRELLPTLIADWRKQFAQGDFPFYIVSLAAFMPQGRSQRAGRLGGAARAAGFDGPHGEEHRLGGDD